MKTSRFISLLLCVVMIMSLFTGLAGSASADDFITHEVQSGEILMKICEKYGLNYYNSKNAIMQLNGFTSETQLARLSVGQKLKLPASGAAAGTVTATTATVGAAALATTAYVAGTATGGSVAFYLVPYTVQPGDTLNKICNEVGSNYYFYSPVIQGINALANPNQIKPGQVLLIPTASPTGASTAVGSHVVKAGETITSIANQYGINYQVQRQLINGLNRRDNMDKIYVGQTVLIPGAAAAAGTTVVTTTTGTAAATTAAATAATTGSYQISVTGATNGSPYVIVNNVQYASSANAGTTVNIVPAPKAGYAVRDIQVIRTDSGTDVPISRCRTAASRSRCSTPAVSSSTRSLPLTAPLMRRFTVQTPTPLSTVMRSLWQSTRRMGIMSSSARVSITRKAIFPWNGCMSSRILSTDCISSRCPTMRSV